MLMLIEMLINVDEIVLCCGVGVEKRLWDLVGFGGLFGADAGKQSGRFVSGGGCKVQPRGSRQTRKEG